MDTKKILYFLNVLNNETEGHADVIAEIYQRALDENDDVIRLRTLLKDYDYYEIGKSYHDQGNRMLNKIYSMPSKSLEILPQLRQVCESIDNEAKFCTELMHSPRLFHDEITILKKSDRFVYRAALEKIAGTCVHLIMIYAGLDPIQSLTWDDSVGIQEMIHAINTKFLPALCNVRRPDQSWMIKKKHLGGKMFFGGDGFYLSYEDTRDIEDFCCGLYKKSIGTHAFLNIDAYESGENDVPFCWGIGNILSSSPDNAILVLQKNIVTKLKSPQGQDLKRKMPEPFECIEHLSDGAMFCISPDELLLAMNQWQIGHEIEVRKQTHTCLFCGARISGKQLVCSSHFSSVL